MDGMDGMGGMDGMDGMDGMGSMGSGSSSGSSQSPSSPMSMSMMGVFHWSSSGDGVWLSSWVPNSEPNYIGACIGLFLFAIMSRGLLAAEIYFVAWVSKRFARLQALDATAETRLSTEAIIRSSLRIKRHSTRLINSYLSVHRTSKGTMRRNRNETLQCPRKILRLLDKAACRHQEDQVYFLNHWICLLCLLSRGLTIPFEVS